MAPVKGEGTAFEGLGRALRWIRQRQGKKQYEVAEAAGITKAMLSSYENGKQRPALDTLERILDALGIDLDYLAHSLRMVRQEGERRGERPSYGSPLAPYLDLERTLGLDRRLEPGEEQAVGQMLEGYHNLLRYILRRSEGAGGGPAEGPADPNADEDGGGSGVPPADPSVP
jgi:transcriptional regulator with XRE-family HTH domain